MTSSDFKKHVDNCLLLLPGSVKNPSSPKDERKYATLFHLYSSIYPELKQNSGTRLDILQMEEGPRKLKKIMEWHIAVSQTTPNDFYRICQMINDYLAEAVP